jgi:predicted CXXCH cytochrome family protein
LLLLAVQSVAGQDPSPGAPGSTATPSPTTAPSATPVQLDVPLASPTPTPAPLRPIPPVPTPLAHPSNGDSNTCLDCHQAIGPTQRVITEQWQESVHGKAGIGCADCHGGDPTSDEITVAMSTAAGFVGKPTRDVSVGICGGCHADVTKMQQYGLPTDQFTKYYSSVHGQQLLVGDSRVAICIDCHGSHDVKKASDPTAQVYPLNVPTLCSSCHSNPDLMASYGIPTDQFAQYKASVHGQQLLEKQDVRAPTCASCHGSHDAKPPVVETIVQICGQCHTATEALYEQARHSKLQGVGPVCVTCHGGHDVVQPDETRFFHPTPPDFVCTTCHEPGTQALRLEADQFANDADRRCDSCHHTGSDIYAQAQGIQTSLQSAADAVAVADEHIAEAAALGMIVTDAEVKLTEARTDLIKGRASSHTTKLGVVAPIASDAQAKASEAQQIADAKLEESVFRREAMVVVVGIILLNVVVLFLLKRTLTRHRRGGSAG